MKLPINNVDARPNDIQITDMLDARQYSNEINLGNVLRIHMRKEWSFFFDSITKVFSGKITNYIAVNYAMLSTAYMVLYDSYFNIGDLILCEIAVKLGSSNNRPKDIYYARFLMIIANHLNENLVIANPYRKWNCWVQSKRVISELMRMNHNSDVESSYCAGIHFYN